LLLATPIAPGCSGLSPVACAAAWAALERIVAFVTAPHG
jgi:hypothetical protein